MSYVHDLYKRFFKKPFTTSKAYETWYPGEMAWPLVYESNGQIHPTPRPYYVGSYARVDIPLAEVYKEIELTELEPNIAYKHIQRVAGFMHLHPPGATPNISQRDLDTMEGWSVALGRAINCGVFNGREFTLWRYYQDRQEALCIPRKTYILICSPAFWEFMVRIPGWVTAFPTEESFFNE